MYFILLPSLISFGVTLLILLGVIRLIRHFVFGGKKKKESKDDSLKPIIEQKEWHKRIAFSPEDFVRQMMYVFMFAFLTVTLTAINKDIGSVFSGITILLIVSIAGLIVGYWRKLLYVIIGGTGGVIAWWIVQASNWSDISRTSSVSGDIRPIAIFFGLVLISIAFFILGKIFNEDVYKKRLALVYSVTSTVFMSCVVLFTSTKAGLYSLEQLSQGAQITVSLPLTLTLLSILAFTLGVHIYAITRNRVSLVETCAFVFYAGLAAVLTITPSVQLFVLNGREYTPLGLIFAVIINILLFLAVVGIIWSGYTNHNSSHINLGAILLFVLIFVKYFDWFDFLEKSIFFTVAGVLLLVLGTFMERARRRMLSTIGDINEVV